MEYDEGVAAEVMERVRQVRGAYLDKMCEIEFILGDLLTAFYGISQLRKMAFRGSVLARMSLSSKIENAKLILAEPSLRVGHGKLLAKLREANELRNSLAHAGAWGSEETYANGTVYLMGAHRGVLAVRGVRVSELEKRADDLSALGAELCECIAALGASP